MISIDPRDRLAAPPPYRSGSRLVLMVLLVAALSVGGFFGWNSLKVVWASGSDNPTIQAALAHYDIPDLAPEALKAPGVAAPLQILGREKCDWPALYDFAGALQKAGYQRAAAVSLTAYSDKCRTAPTALRLASDIFGALADYPTALTTANKLIAASPTDPDNYYLVGQLSLEAGDFKGAVDAITSTISLTDDLSSLNSTVFVRLAESYARQNEYCEAASTIETWVSISRENDTAAAKTLLGQYADQGACGTQYANGEDSFPITGSDVILVEAKIGDSVGLFVVDTGASSVVVSQEFAVLAGMPFDESSTVRMQTANGVSSAHSTIIPQMSVGRASASEIPAIVIPAGALGLGNEVDGLLGRSFLSRFEVVFADKQWSLRPKAFSQSN